MIEVLVASGLLAGAIAGLAQLMVIATRANADARDATYAAVLAAQKLEELRALPYPGSAVVESGDSLDADGAGVWGGAEARQAAFERRWTIEPLPAYPGDAVVVSVVVTRLGVASRVAGSPGPARQPGAVRLTTIRTRKGP